MIFILYFYNIPEWNIISSSVCLKLYTAETYFSHSARKINFDAKQSTALQLNSQHRLKISHFLSTAPFWKTADALFDWAHQDISETTAAMFLWAKGWLQWMHWWLSKAKPWTFIISWGFSLGLQYMKTLCDVVYIPGWEKLNHWLHSGKHTEFPWASWFTWICLYFLRNFSWKAQGS